MSARFLPAAREELIAAAAYYDAGTPGLGEEFLAEAERAVRRVVDFPECGHPHLADTRRVLLRRFPFAVVYVSETDAVLIVAVAHHSRRPAYWSDRTR